MENKVSENYLQGGLCIRFAPEMANMNRRALWDINNIVGTPHQHTAVIKRDLLYKPVALDANNKAGSTRHRLITIEEICCNAGKPTYKCSHDATAAAAAGLHAFDDLSANEEIYQDAAEEGAFYAEEYEEGCQED